MNFAYFINMSKVNSVTIFSWNGFSCGGCTDVSINWNRFEFMSNYIRTATALSHWHTKWTVFGICFKSNLLLISGYVRTHQRTSQANISCREDSFNRSDSNCKCFSVWDEHFYMWWNPGNERLPFALSTRDLSFSSPACVLTNWLGKRGKHHCRIIHVCTIGFGQRAS